jgi:hypothetical protein
MGRNEEVSEESNNHLVKVRYGSTTACHRTAA